MNLLLWTGLFSLSLSWLFTLNLYTREGSAWWIILITAGVASVAASLRGSIGASSFDKKWLLLPVPLFLLLMVVPFPYLSGVLLILAGVFSLMLLPLTPVFAFLSSGLILSGAVLIVQSPLGFLYTTFTSYARTVFWCDGLLYRIFSFFDVPVSYSQNTFYVQTIKDLYDFPTTWDRLAIFPVIAIWIGSIPLLYIFSNRGERGRRFIKLLLVSGAYVIARYVLMILVFLYLMTFVEYREDVCWVNVFWDARVTLCSFLPLILLLGRTIPLADKAEGDLLTIAHFDMSPGLKKALAYFTFGFCMVGLLYGFQDPGREKQGRVLLDEKHSGWEKSTRKMDTEWYGNESGYNFYWMAEFINHHFPLTRNFQELTPDLLSRYDILILKNATSPFSDAEVKAIRQFVVAGGGLYLMSEHTNIFGNSTYSNPIAEEFGFSFRYDVLFDIERKFEQLYVPPRIAPHPVVQHVPYFCFKVSCSIQPVSSRCESIMTSRGAKAQDIYYPSGNFYPQVKDHTYMPFGAFLQMVGVKSGKGRVVGFTDSTTYSNFEAFFAGKPELLLGALSWLNRENRWSRFHFLFLVLASVCFSVGVKTLLREKRNWFFYLVLVVCAFFATIAFLVLCQTINRRNYPLPYPRTPYTRVVFEREHGDYELPLQGFTKEHARSYEVFYQWVLRVGFYPFTGTTLEDDVKQANMVVIINPQKTFSQDERARVREYIAGGGKMLLMDNPANDGSTANELLAELGMVIKTDRQVTLPDPYGAALMGSPAKSRGLAIEGGKGLLRSVEGEPVLSAAQLGMGTAAVMTFSQLFTNPPMGGSYRVQPNQRQRDVYELQFDILNGLENGNLEDLFTRSPNG